MVVAASPQIIKKGRGFRRGLCRRVVKGRVDGPPGRGLWPPAGGGLCSLRSGGDSACGAEGGGLPWGHFVARVQKVQKVQKVQRVVAADAANLKKGARLSPRVV